MFYPIDYPKIQAPFRRQGEPYLVIPEINPDYEWVFKDAGVSAIDKIDGTNVCLFVENGTITHCANRTTEGKLLDIKASKWECALSEGITACLKRGWGEYVKEGYNYGELIGEIFNDNRHQIEGHLWVPFEYLKKKCAWHSWEENKYPKIYEAISEWFKTIPSLFNKKLKLPDIMAEGLVFCHPDGRLSKLRRDMFPWYEGIRHNDKIL